MAARHKTSMITVLLFLCLLSSHVTSYAQTEISTPLFWEQSISQALSSRDLFYQNLGVGPQANRLRELLQHKEGKQLQKMLSDNEQPSNPWFQFLYGLSYLNNDKKKTDYHFQQALKLCQNDPGTTWVLFIEFEMTDNFRWAQRSLEQLEKQKILAGAHSIPAVSQQLLTLERKNRDTTGAIDYLHWSRRFEQFPIGQSLYEAQRSFFSSPLKSVRSILEILEHVSDSWELQLSVFRYGYRFFRAAFLIFLIATILALSLKALPSVLHPITEFFPPTSSPYVRLILSIIIYFSFLGLGIFPFLLAHVILVLPLMKERRRIFIASSTVLILFGPIDARINSFLSQILSPQGTVSLYRESVRSGYTPELASSLVHAMEQNPRDHLPYLSAAILSLKKGDIPKALHYSTIAENIEPNDPVHLVTAGNIYFAQGNLKKAATYYQECINRYPDYEEGYFNLGQYNFLSLQTMRGTEMIAQATDINEERVNSFIEINDDLFANDWPRIRKTMQADYKPSFFWSRIASAHKGDWKQALRFLSIEYMNFPPWLFLLASTAAAIIFLHRGVKGTKKNFYCRLCGMPMCKKCRNGMLCTDCVKLLQICRDNPEDLNKAEQKIKKRTEKVRTFISHLLNAFFPGTGSVFSGEKQLQGILLILISSVVYTFYAVSFSLGFSYPYWVVGHFLRTGLVFCLLFSLSFFICVIMSGILSLSGEKSNVD